MAKPFTKVPVELLQPIFSNLRPWDLVSISLTCKSFARASKPLLWSQVTINCDRDIAYAYHEQPEAKIIIANEELKKSNERARRVIRLILETNNGELVRDFHLRSGWTGIRMELWNKLPNFGFDTLFASFGQNLRSIEISNESLPYLEGFTNLQSLHIHFTGCLLQFGKRLPCTGELKTVKDLKVEWRLAHDRPPAFFGPTFLSLIGQYLSVLTELRSFTLYMPQGYFPKWDPTVYYQPYFDGRGRGRTLDNDLKNLRDSIYLSQLRDVRIEVWRSFMNFHFLLEPTEMGGEDIVIFPSSVFRNFLSRHSNVIERFEWSDILDCIHAGSSYKIPALRGLKRLTVDLDPDHISLSPSNYIFRKLAQTPETLEILTLYGWSPSGFDHLFLFQSSMLPFINLKVLKLYNLQIVDGEEGYNKEEADLSAYVQSKITFLAECFSVLPEGLERLSMSMNMPATVPPKVLDGFKSTLNLAFYRLDNLEALKFKIFTFDGEVWDSEPEPIEQMLVFRMLSAGEIGKPSTKKKIGIWHVEPCHAKHGLLSHRSLRSYTEKVLDGEFQLGRCGKKWDFLEMQEMFLRKIWTCNVMGHGSCRHLLQEAMVTQNNA